MIKNIPINKIKDINSFNFKNKKVLLRADFNVPVNDAGKITDDTRIKSTIPTIKKILSDEGKIIILSHFGRPKGIQSKKYSIKFLVNYLYENIKMPIQFSSNCIGIETKKKIDKLKNQDIILLENLRFHKEEEEENEKFSYELSKLGDFYVNDAFGVSHRFHSSITILPKFFKKKCIGFLMKKEINNINIFLSGKAKRPVTIILGGSKVFSKLSIIQNLMNFSDYILLGGLMPYPFIKKIGGKIGLSLNEKFNNENFENLLDKILYKNQEKNNIIFPKDVIISNNMINIKNSNIDSIPNRWKGLDIGINTIKRFHKIIDQSNSILWNGPMGFFEKKLFSFGTISIAKKIAQVTREKNVFSIIGGGDSILALKLGQCINDINYISTGGGSMLECLKYKILPGINAIIS